MRYSMIRSLCRWTLLLVHIVSVRTFRAAPGTLALKRGLRTSQRCLVPRYGQGLPYMVPKMALDDSEDHGHGSLPVKHSPAFSRRAALVGAAAFLLGAKAPSRTAVAETAVLDAPSTAPPALTGVTTPPAPKCNTAISHLVAADGAELFLIGTAHISKDSAILVRDVIRAGASLHRHTLPCWERCGSLAHSNPGRCPLSRAWPAATVKPDAVMVELDESRVRSVKAATAAADPAVGAAADGAAPPPPPPPPKTVWELVQREAARPGAGVGQKVRNIEAGLIGMAISTLYTKLNTMGFSSGEELATGIREVRRAPRSHASRRAARSVSRFGAGAQGRAAGARIILGDRPVAQVSSLGYELFRL